MAEKKHPTLRPTGNEEHSQDHEASTVRLGSEARSVMISRSPAQLASTTSLPASQHFSSPTGAIEDQDQTPRSDRSYADQVVTDPVQLPVQLKDLPRRGAFYSIEEWEGVVLDVQRDSFAARLINRSHRGLADEEGRFPMSQLTSPEDRGLIAPGSIFYFSVGYVESPAGQRRTSTFLRFRRLPAWTKGELQEISAEADRLAEVFGVSEEQQGSASSG